MGSQDINRDTSHTVSGYIINAVDGIVVCQVQVEPPINSGAKPHAYAEPVYAEVFF